MAKSTAYLFCRYTVLDDGDPIAPDEEWEILQEIRAQPIAYRVRQPQPNDFDTFLMKPRRKSIRGYTVHTWEIAQDVRIRTRTRYHREDDEVSDDQVATDEIKHTKFVSLPLLGVLAVDDSVGDRTVGARSAVGRFAAVVETLVEDTEVIVNLAGTPDDARRALETWTLDEFTFTVRPFNPTPRKLGEKIHELLMKDHVGRLQAVARAAPGKDMRDSHQGLISEATGLSDEGYGQYGARGTTPDGYRAKINKPKFTMDKEKNKIAQAQNRTLKVYIPRGDNPEAEEGAIVKALIDLYG
jgi:hypothetical protein